MRIAPANDLLQLLKGSNKLANIPMVPKPDPVVHCDDNVLASIAATGLRNCEASFLEAGLGALPRHLAPEDRLQYDLARLVDGLDSIHHEIGITLPLPEIRGLQILPTHREAQLCFGVHRFFRVDEELPNGRVSRLPLDILQLPLQPAVILGMGSGIHRFSEIEFS